MWHSALALATVCLIWDLVSPYEADRLSAQVVGSTCYSSNLATPEDSLCDSSRLILPRASRLRFLHSSQKARRTYAGERRKCQGVMVNVAESETVGSKTEVAVTVTEGFNGTVRGALYWTE